MGEKEILSRNIWIGGEFRPPTYRAYAEALDQCPWTAISSHEQELIILPYNSIYDGWLKSPERHNGGVMTRCMNSYEYAYELWESRSSGFYPDLTADGTFGVWLGLLPEPVSINVCGSQVELKWGPGEPRVHRSHEMGRYLLSDSDRQVRSFGSSWRLSRAEAYVMAWEKMAANEPADRYESVIRAEQNERERREQERKNEFMVQDVMDA